jgi:hypothetical protein
LDLAVSVDPQSQFDSAVQVKSGQSKVYVDWGNDLLQQKQFSVAIEKFELAISKSEESNTDAKDALANGQIQWARDLSTNEDFQAALQHLQTAQETAASEGMKKSVETALQETYLAFSNSSGMQARQAMKEALKAVCGKHKAPDLPIFGLNKDSIRFGIYGVEDKLPEDLAAKTPGEMHYIACVEAKNITLESRPLYLKAIERTGRGYHYIFMKQYRTQLLWNIHLLKMDTAKRIAETTLKGGAPPSFTEAGGDGGSYIYGPAPTMEEFSEWLESVIE